MKGTAASGAQSTKETLANGAKSAGGAIGGVARKAKGPALAGGAALAGLVGGIAVARRNGPRRVLGVPVPGTAQPLVKVKVPRRGMKLPSRSAAKLPMPKSARDVHSLVKQVGKASKQAGETGQDVGKKIQRLGEQAERVGKTLS